MGNLPPGFSKYQHPIAPPAMPLSWPGFVNDCGIAAHRVPTKIFEAQFKDRVVFWSGLLTSKGSKECKFMMNPTECKLTNSELTVDIPAGMAPLTNMWAEKMVCQFKAMIKSQGHQLNHHLTLVDASAPFDPSCSWLNFVQLCGSAAQEAPRDKWTQFYHNKMVTWHAKVLSVTQLPVKASEITPTTVSHHVALQMFPQAEDHVLLEIPYSLQLVVIPTLDAAARMGEFVHFNATMQDMEWTYLTSTRVHLRFVGFAGPMDGDQSYLQATGAFQAGMNAAYQAGMMAGAMSATASAPPAPGMQVNMQMGSPQPQMQMQMASPQPGAMTMPNGQPQMQMQMGASGGAYQQPQVQVSMPMPVMTMQPGVVVAAAPAPMPGQPVGMGPAPAQAPRQAVGMGPAQTQGGFNLSLPGFNLRL